MKAKICTLLFIVLTFSQLKAQKDSIAPDFKVTDVDGTTHFLYDYLDAGKHVFIDFFTTGCGGCQLYAPQINESFRQFGCNESDVIFLAINFGADDEAVKIFDSIYGIEFPSISGQDGQGNSVIDQYNISYFPRVMAIAPNKQIVINEIGDPTTQNVNDTLLSLGLELAECITFDVNELSNCFNNDFNIFPNPASNANATTLYFTIKNSSIINFKIYNILGGEVKQTNAGYFAEGSHETKVGLDNLEKGIYFIKMFINNKASFTQKLILK